VKHLLQIGADLNSFDARGETALHLAVRNENELMVDYLLVYEADPNATSSRDKSTPLHLCAYHGFIKCATALVKAGADLEAKTEDGYTPFRVAIDRDQVDFAIWLVEKNNANVNCMDDLGETILTYAVRVNKPSLIDFLLDAGAAPDLVDDRNLSACMVAARADDSELLRLLVSRGAKVDATNSDGKTALHFAASSGSAAAAQTLIELGANVDARDEQGNTALHESCKHSKFSVSARLVANKAELNFQGGDGLTPLALAICGNDDDTIALLMSNGAS
jgi:ankyrin repeat protein